MKSGTVARRTFLRGLGGLLVALPTLESLGCSTRGATSEISTGTTRQALGENKRLIQFFTPYGAAPGYFPTGGTETSFTLTPQLAPFEPHKQDLLILEEIDLLPFIAKGYDGVGHGAPYCYVIGGWPIFQGDETPGPGGISLDQKVAQSVGQGTRLKSLPINLGNTEQIPMSTLSYTAANQWLPGLRDPAATFNKVFSGFNVDPALLQAIHDERKSVLDFVLDDYAALSTKVSASDKKAIDFHMQSVRELESQLANIAASQQACTVPTLNNPPQDLGTWQQGAGPNVLAIAKFQMDLIVTALACDITRVVSMAWQTDMSWDSGVVGLDPSMFVGDAHIASHVDQTAFAKVTTWYATQFSAFIQKLKDKNVFDNALFMWFSENGANPGGHSPYNMPYLLVGNAGGSFRTGRHIKCGHRSPNDLYISIQNAFGVADSTFGDPAACKGPITALDA